MSVQKISKKEDTIVLDVVIENNGVQQNLKMALDTGATYVTVPKNFIDALNIRVGSLKQKGELISASGIEPVSIVILERVKALVKEVRNVEVMVHDLPPQSSIDGLLGLNLLKNFNVHINFKEGILFFE
ncbi:retroviral-like aspartic protease family protein [Candidatus Woesearchaeota archaeon]|nr:retroviral-like aspartic protease family protein [Candidatus Woesearchaeota archaeon]